MTIVNNFTHPIIEDDDRDPMVSWANHKSRGSAGGVDLAYSFGTPIHAPADGEGNGLNTLSGSGGRMYNLVTAEGVIQFLHLSSIVKTGTIKVGDIIAYSGASGYDAENYYDAHLHVHIVVNGARKNLWDYFESQFNEENMRKISVGNKIYFVGPKGIIHIANPQHLDLINRVMTNTRTDFNEAEIDILKLYM